MYHRRRWSHHASRSPVNTKRFTSFHQGVGGWVQTTTAAARALAAHTDVLLTVLGRPWATKSAYRWGVVSTKTRYARTVSAVRGYPVELRSDWPTTPIVTSDVWTTTHGSYQTITMTNRKYRVPQKSLEEQRELCVPPQVLAPRAGFCFLPNSADPTVIRDMAPAPRQVSALPQRPTLRTPRHWSSRPAKTGDRANHPPAFSVYSLPVDAQVRAARWEPGLGKHGSPRRPRGVCRRRRRAARVASSRRRVAAAAEDERRSRAILRVPPSEL